MSRLRCHISISLDGFVAGPNQSEENPQLEQVRAVEAPGVTHLNYGLATS